MTGPEHYRRAEKLAALAQRQEPELAQANAALAQVHATLAVAAATAMSVWNSPEMPMPQPDREAWEKAASERPAAMERLRHHRAAEKAEFMREGS